MSTITVTTEADDNEKPPGTVTLRDAITKANDTPGPDNIVFDLPTVPLLDLTISHSGFDSTTQTWHLAPDGPLPAITDQVTIDGYSQAHTPVPFRYPVQEAPQIITFSGNPTGGNFTLSTSAPLPPGTTGLIPFNATSAQVRFALAPIVGDKNVVALPGSTVSIAFTGKYTGLTTPVINVASSNLSGGVAPGVGVFAGLPSPPTEITSNPNGMPIGAAIDGNNATPRVIIDGSQSGGAATGFEIDASDSILRGLIIDGFGVGVSVPNPGVVGVLIQGNDIGKYRVSPVDPVTGSSLLDSSGGTITRIDGQGNLREGVRLGSTNATVGGVEPQDNNVIIGNGQQGVSILPGAQGNQVIGNQIGIVGPQVALGFYAIVGNGAEGVLIGASSNYVGGPTRAAGNLISGNRGDGVRIVGPDATRNNVRGNYIGVAPAGGYLFGSGGTGNLGDGVTIQDAGDNVIGGPSPAYENVISANAGAGVRVFGTSAVRNLVQSNIIGLTADGVSALGNSQEGVAIYSPLNVVGPSNVISANLRGVLLSGLGATSNQVRDNLIGTDGTGKADLGNALEGVRIEGASDNRVFGNGAGSQVISGNNVGVLIVGQTAVPNTVLGNFIGTDVTGMFDLGNSREGVRVENSPGNTIGGQTAPARNLISANHWGVVLTGPSTTDIILQGNFIGTDVTGSASPGNGNELDGVLVTDSASRNLIGGSAAAGNTIAFNKRDGVRVEGLSVRNAILGNSVYANLELGINLYLPPELPDSRPNMLQAAPTLLTVATSVGSTIIRGRLNGAKDTTYTIQFFFNTPMGPGLPVEGQQFVGEVTTLSGDDGVANYSVNVPTILKSGQMVTATATDPSGATEPFGNTSEFSSPPITEVFGTVQFQMAGFTVGEEAGTATIVSTRSGGSGGFFTVDYATADGSAQAGSDYLPTSGTLTFNPGEYTKTFTIPIVDDGQPDADETVLLSLSNPAGAIILGAQATAVLTILGNQPGAFQFSMANYSVDVAGGTATITVDRSQSGITSSVNYATSDGTARAGVDYLTSSGTLTFGPGESVKTFTIPILINPLIRGNKTVLLNLLAPTLGTPSTAVLVIVDDMVNRMGPHVTSARAVAGPFGVASVILTFDELLDPARAVDLLNYGYSVRTAGRDGKLGTADDRIIGLCPATYDPATRTVTLPLATAVANNTRLEIMINAATDVAGANVGVSDLLGNLLDGNNDGHPGGAYSAILVAQPAPHKVASKSKIIAKPVKHPVVVAPVRGPAHGKAAAPHHR